MSSGSPASPMPPAAASSVRLRPRTLSAPALASTIAPPAPSRTLPPTADTSPAPGAMFAGCAPMSASIVTPPSARKPVMAPRRRSASGACRSTLPVWATAA